MKLQTSLRQEIQDKSRLAENLQRQLSGISSQREELEKARSEIDQFSGLPEIESQLTQASKMLEELQSAGIRRVQLEESKDNLQAKIAEKTKQASSLGSPKPLDPKPRRVWTYLISTSTLGAGAILSFFLGLPQVAVAFGSLAIASLLLLSRQIVSLSQQASSSRYDQEQLASLQLVSSWETELAEAQQNLTDNQENPECVPAFIINETRSYRCRSTRPILTAYRTKPATSLTPIRVIKADRCVSTVFTLISSCRATCLVVLPSAISFRI